MKIEDAESIFILMKVRERLLKEFEYISSNFNKIKGEVVQLQIEEPHVNNPVIFIKRNVEDIRNMFLEDINEDIIKIEKQIREL